MPKQLLLRLRADVLLGGTNDIGGTTGPISLDETTWYLETITHLTSQENIKVIMCTVLPVSDCHYDHTSPTRDPRGPYTQKRPLEKIRALNDWIRQHCLQNSYTCLDYYAMTVDEEGKLREDYSFDDLHPNDS